MILLLMPWWMAASEADLLLVNANQFIADTSNRPYGLNLNYILDASHRFPAGSWTLDKTLGQLRPGFLRYPGGEKSDHHLWSEKPFARPWPTLLPTGLGAWMAKDIVGANPDGHWSPERKPMDTDEFLQLCKSLGASPVFVVAYDVAWYDQHGKALTPAASRAMRNRLREAAVAWVRYVRASGWTGPTWWEIGNEVDQGPIPGFPTATDYVADVIEFADDMHLADPSARIGMCGAMGQRLQAHVDALAARQRLDAIDFLAAHTYPTSYWRGYDDWQMKAADLTQEYLAATRIIKALPEPHCQRLRVAMTEVGLIDYSKKGWANHNDLGHALVAADLMGAHLSSPSLLFVLWWNTRWFSSEIGDDQKSTDLLSKNNHLLPTAEALAAWGRVLDERMIKTTGTDRVRIYAAGDVDHTRMRLLLIHRGREAQAVKIKIDHAPAGATKGIYRILTGSGPADLAPTWRDDAEVPILAGSIELALPPVSMTVLSIDR